MINIQNMTLGDFELIKNTLSSEFNDFWTSKTLKSELANNNSKYIVAKTNLNEILGFAGIWKATDDIHIMNIAVKKDFRNQGIRQFIT